MKRKGILKTVALVLIFLFLATGCNLFGSVSTSGYPKDVIPLIKDAKAYSYENDDDSSYTVKLKTDDDIEDVIDYYKEYFEENEITLGSVTDDSEGYIASGYYEGYQFTVDIHFPSASQKDAETVIEIELTAAEEETSTRSKFKEDKVSVEATGTISATGGVVKLPENSVLAGGSVKVPAAAFDKDIKVSIGTVTGTFSNAPQSISQTAFHLDLDGYTNVAQPLEITLKYVKDPSDIEKVPSALYINEEGELLPVITKCINKTAGTFTFLSFHASTFTYYLLDDITLYPDDSATDYLPSVDGFSEKNEGSSVFSGGECYGMSSFSKWYFLNKKANNKGFHDQFQSPQMGTSPTGDIITPQDVIATKAFQYTTKQSAILFTEEQRFSSYVTVDQQGNETYAVDNSVAVRCIMDSIFFWDQPAEVGIYGTAGHSVLAYSYKKTATEITIYIYDPNFPGEDDQKIVYNIANKTISTPSYNAGFLDKTLTTTGYGTFSSVNEYEDILKDANNNFAASQADVEITSPANGATVDQGTVYITGTVDTLTQMGEQVGDMVEIVTDAGAVFRAPLTKNGSAASSFNINVPIKNGENRFLINTYFYDQNNNEQVLFNDQYGWFTVNSTVAANVVYITLTWDAQPDVDLYVTDPTGETSYYQHKYTQDGGVLDIDDTSGYGPEHWTLTTANTVRWNQPYTVRLHYYNGSSPTSYKITVLVNEGTPNEFSRTYSGVLSTSNSSNASPGGSGADWVDICTVTPSN